MSTHETTPGSSPLPVLPSPPAGEIPTLSPEQALGAVPEAVRLALEARAAEKRALMALSGELLDKLRPDMERLAAELVQRTLAEVWEKRVELYRHV